MIMQVKNSNPLSALFTLPVRGVELHSEPTHIIYELLKINAYLLSRLIFLDFTLVGVGLIIRLSI